jgi:hypothetical protein
MGGFVGSAVAVGAMVAVCVAVDATVGVGIITAELHAARVIETMSKPYQYVFMLPPILVRPVIIFAGTIANRPCPLVTQTVRIVLGANCT